MAKRAVKKKATAPKGRKPRVTKDAEIDNDANNKAIKSKDSSSKRPKIHAKVVQVSVSIGTHDRGRSYEDFVEDVTSRLNGVPYGEEGNHVAVTGGYYILDGKVCLPDDYDEKRGTFKEGTTPPSWAGGPSRNPRTGLSSMQSQMEKDVQNLSSDAYDKKYGIGKYAPAKADRSRLITPEMQRKMREEDKRKKEAKEDEDIEEIEWDENDVGDDEKLGAISDESAKKAVKTLKSSKKRKVRRKK